MEIHHHALIVTALGRVQPDRNPFDAGVLNSGHALLGPEEHGGSVFRLAAGLINGELSRRSNAELSHAIEVRLGLWVERHGSSLLGRVREVDEFSAVINERQPAFDDLSGSHLADEDPVVPGFDRLPCDAYRIRGRVLVKDGTTFGLVWRPPRDPLELLFSLG